MNSLNWTILLLLLGITAWSWWRYYNLQKKLETYSNRIKTSPAQNSSNHSQLQGIASAVNSIVSNYEEKIFALDSEKDRLSTVLEQLTDGVLIANADGAVQYANPAACRIFEYPQPIHHSVAEIIREHQLIEAWRRCQQTRVMQTESVELQKRHYLQLFAIPDQHAGGSLLLVQDLTRVRKLETVRRDFISNVSHELRTPLASLKALTETLQDGALSDPEAGPRFLGRISTEVDALTQMAQELLDLSRIETGQVELVMKKLNPKELLTSTEERMKMQAERANLKLEVNCADDLPFIHADKSRLEQVLVNIIHNAVKFTKPGGKISLEAEPGSSSIRFAVRDTGAGIPAESLSRIFERFYRVDRARTGSGTGLGLSISKHIVEAHKGKIWAESEEGSGSTFYFEIPTR